MPDESKPPRKRPYNVYLPRALHDWAEAVAAARIATNAPGARTVSGICQEALETHLPSIDMTTGQPRPQSAAAAPTVLFTANLPVFGESKSYEQFADDAALDRRIDQTEMLVWRAGRNTENLRVSPALAALAGRPPAAFLVLGWSDFLHPFDRVKTMDFCVRRFATHEPFEFAYRFRRSDGVYLHMIDLARPRFHADGTFAGYVGTLNEVVGADPTRPMLMAGATA
jgi:PAS domain-containing protein